MSSAEQRRLALVPWLLGAGAALLYLGFPSAYYNFDGVACAIAVELGDLKHLAHGNHLAYGLLGWAWTGLWRLFGYAGPALPALQALDSLLGGLGAGLFCRFLLRRLSLPPLAAVSASAGLSLSYAWWFWSLEAQVYLLGAVFLVLAADAAWAEEPSPWGAGACLGCAALGHVGHVMFLPAALCLIHRPGKARRLWPRFAAAFCLTVLAAYGAAALCCVKPHSPEDWRLWLLGSAALSPDRSFTWHGAGTAAASLSAWLAMTLRIFADPVGLPQPWSSLGWLLAAAALAAAVAGLRGRRGRTAKAAWLWLGGYAALYICWQPFTMVYRITDLIVLWLLIAHWAAPSPWRGRALAGLALALGLFNAILLIRPQTDPGRNAAYQEALRIARDTPEEAWVLAAARGQVYIPYFAGRNPLNLRYFEGRPEALDRRLEQLLREGSPVFVPGSVHDDGAWKGFFARHELEPAGAPDGRLYRIGTKGKPSGSSTKKLNTAPAARKGPKGTGSAMRSSPFSTRPTP
jgi:hypothetical protein